MITKTQAIRKANQTIKNQYPSNTKANWVQPIELVKWPTGKTEYFGRVELSAPGYNTNIMNVSIDDTSVFIK